MANSKSNIYPIQLQNAELNLNKFDAEIKQYSGFNKNNAPFIGGCLSNIFSKDAVIEGSTYIDTDGTIYKVDSEGFYQNDNKLVSYNPNVKFYNKRKIGNGVYVKFISEKIYITIERAFITESSYEAGSTGTEYWGNAFVAHWGDGYKRVMCSSQEGLGSIVGINVGIEKKDGVITFSVKRSKNVRSNLKDLSYLLIVPDEDSDEYYYYTPGFYFTKDTSFNIFNNFHPDAFYKGSPQNVFIDDDYIFYADNVRSGQSSVYVFNKNGEYISQYTSITKGSFFYNQAYLSYSLDVKYWYMTNDGVFHLYGDTDSFLVPDDGSSYYLIINMKPAYENNSLVISQSSNITFIRPLISTTAGCSFAGKNIYIRCNSQKLTPYGALMSYFIRDANNNTKGQIYSICNEWYNYSFTMPQAICTTGFVFFKDGFKVLYNNNEISNISIYNTYRPVSDEEKPSSLHGAIVEDWNNIKDFVIYEGKCVYKDYENNYFIIEPTDKPKLMLKNTQLVVNCNYEQNCFDLRYKKVLHFGSDWNCSYFGNYSPSGRYGTIERENEYLIASAINEYNQKENPSLLLNMQTVTYPLVDRTGPFDILALMVNSAHGFNSFIKDYIYPINFYEGNISDNKCIYENSSNYINNPYSVGLPFPNNTDGNVQYNPNIFSEFISGLGTDVFVKNYKNVYQLMKEGQNNIMAFFLGTLVESLENVFVIQGQYYGIINNQIFSIRFEGGVVSGVDSVVNIQGLQFCGNTPYEALFYSATNKCLYSFSGANILSPKQFVDKISLIRKYKYNPATQSIFLLTDIGVIVTSLFGIYMIDMPAAEEVFLLEDGIVLNDNDGNFKYIKYYKENTDDTYTKENIKLETMFYGMNNQTVTINDCLYIRLFSEDHEEGQLKIKATTLSLTGRQTEETIFNIHASDWDVLTHSIYIRYQPQEQRGLGISFDIDSPFKIASMSVGSQADAILIDKVSKSAINSPAVKSNSVDW